MKNFEFIVDFPNEEKGLELVLTIESSEGLTEKESLNFLNELLRRNEIKKGFRSTGSVILGKIGFIMDYSVCVGFNEDPDGDDDWKDVSGVVSYDPLNTSKLDDIIKGTIENKINGIIEELSGEDLYQSIVTEFEKEGISVEGSGIEESSEFLIDKDFIKETIDELVNCYSQRFYFNKEDLE